MCGDVTCGPNAECHEEYGKPVCRCFVGYVPLPRPHLGCTKPLEAILCNPGPCGRNADCEVSHAGEEKCHCRPGFTGDPWKSCIKVSESTGIIDPCVPSPCGRNTVCRPHHQKPRQAICDCLPGYHGDPISQVGCKPECEVPSECAPSETCINFKCVKACRGACGVNADCTAVHHAPKCHCQPGYQGNPLIACTKEPSPIRPPSLPVTECSVNDHCSNVEVCQRGKCIDPCTSRCGINAVCNVENHRPTCRCRDGYKGNPFTLCDRERVPVITPPISCYGNPCGPNSKCDDSGARVVCTCLAGYFGQPPNCRPECLISTDCPLDKACIREKCEDPCRNICGKNAHCRMQSHKPICTCNPGYTGNPFRGCQVIPGKRKFEFIISTHVYVYCCRTSARATCRPLPTISMWA